MQPFEWFILAMASFRLQRIVTSDSWYPTQAWREWVNNRAKPDKKKQKQTFRTELAELFSCPWCFGWWVTVGVFLEYHYLEWVPMWVYALCAASGLVGMLGTYDDR